MEQLRNESTDRTAHDETSDTWFYLPGMPSPSLESSRPVRFVTKLLRRRGVLPADFLRER